MRRSIASGSPRPATRGGSRLLARLERARAEFGSAAAARKLTLLEALDRAVLDTPRLVARLHDALCFLQAYPDGPRLLARVERMLVGFDRRRDLKRHRAALTDTGIAGTAIEYRFFWPTADWLTRRWARRLTIVWKDFEQSDRLADLLPLFTLYGETPALDEIDYPAREWLARLKGPNETDAGFLVRRIAALPMDSFTREKLYDQLDPPLRLEPGRDTPARTRAKLGRGPVSYQVAPLDRARPDLGRELRRAPSAVRALRPREAQRFIDLARASMVTRSRDLDAFSWGDPRDVRLVEWERGLRFAVIGVIPERRLMLEAVYALLTLKNGVPIGYVLNSALYRSAEIAFNVFETWRGAEAGWVYARALATVRHLFGTDSFTVFPYQLGEGNQDALQSGAWWFYQKLGFRPRDPAVRRLMRDELARMRADAAHRSSVATLRRLARANLYFDLGRPRDDVIGVLPLPAVGLAVQRQVAARFGSDRERAARACAEEAARLLDVRSRQGWDPGEQLAWERWSPLALALDEIRRWNARERRALVAVIRAKGSRRESEFAHAFDRHGRLRAAIRRVALREDAANP